MISSPCPVSKYHDLHTDTGYAIALTYGGQMTRAIKNMMVHQCLAGNISNSLHIVEPFSRESNLFHSPEFWKALDSNQSRDAARFSDYYDLSYYNEKSAAECKAPLVTWEEFLQKAPRNAVVLKTPEQSCGRWTDASAYSTNSPVRFLTECSFRSTHDSFLQGLQSYNFTFIKTICVDCKYLHRTVTVEELRDEIYGKRSVSEVTVIFGVARNFGFMSSWLQLPSWCKETQDGASKLVPSKSILNHAEYYRRNILQNGKLIAIMFRIERFLEATAGESVASCLNMSVQLHDKLKQNPSMSSSSTFLTMDVGRFGSSGMQRVNSRKGDPVSIHKIVEDTVSYLYNGQWTLQDWEDSFVKATGGITERGYIAMLQQAIAIHSDCLILMGGGSYQEVAAHRYVIDHPDKQEQCLHTVCMKERWNKSFHTAAAK